MTETCVGCGALFEPEDGPIHPYMLSSAACFRRFTDALAAEYSDLALMATHRLTVDTFAIQHPGKNSERRAVQSVALHLTRLTIQLSGRYSPQETNDVMLGLGKFKEELTYLAPPSKFTLTTADLARHTGTDTHAAFVREWAQATLDDWSAHKETVQGWITRWQNQ